MRGVLFIFIYVFVFYAIKCDGKTVNMTNDVNLVCDRLIDMCLAESMDFDCAIHDMNNIQLDGSWRDVDYTTVTFYFDAEKHLKRLKNMALAYNNSQCKLYHNEELKNKIVLGLDFFKRINPISGNWWYMDIGAPIGYMIPLLLIKKNLNKDILMNLSSYLTDKTGNLAHKGKNRTWVSSVLIYKGCIEDNYELVKKGFSSIASTIYIEEKDDEGIKSDCSIHQHRTQLYSGGYGMAFMSDLAEFISLASNTSFMDLFSCDKIKIISDVMLKGTQLFGYRNSFDFGTIGRGICGKGSLHNMPVHTLELMKGIDKKHAQDYDAWIKHIKGGKSPILGNKFFWKSNIMTHHGMNYYMSAKVISVRSNGTEMLNGQNLKGYYLPLGATNIMTTGNEYDDVFVVWDWTRVPGTTGVANSSTANLEWYFFGSNYFAGGVSDGSNGIVSYEHVYRGVQGKKSYFFIGDAMICMGSDITAARTQTVRTSVNQCLANGDIFYGIDGAVKKMNDSILKQKKVEWAYHDNVGYIFPEKRDNTVIQKVVQTGSWKDLEVTASPEIVAKEIFSIWSTHGNIPQNDTYCYIVMPDKPLSFFVNEEYKNNIEIVANTGKVQAVIDRVNNIYAAVFHQPGHIVFDDDLMLEVDKAVLICITKKGNRYQISVADPLYKEKTVRINISKFPLDQRSGFEELKNLVINFPTGDYVGSTTTVVFDNLYK